MNFRRNVPEPKAAFPEVPFPADAPITPKHIGFLFTHCRMQVTDIVAHYRGRVTPALVHLGLYHYYQNKTGYDAELAEGAKLNRNDALKDVTMTLPSVGLGSLVESMEDEPNS